MKRKRAFKTGMEIFVPLAALVLFWEIAVCVSAGQGTEDSLEQQSGEEYRTVYIAGCADCLPLEGVQDGRHVGIMPQFFEKLSEITGIRFEYLESNADRYELAENLQCEILSMVTEDDESIRERGLVPGPVCFSYENVEYRIAYTGRMPEQMIGIMDAAIEGMSEEDRLQCAIAGAEELLTARKSGRIRAVMWILAGLCAGLLVLLAVSVNRSRKNMKKVMIMDSVTRLYNRDGFAEAFSRLKNQRQFPLFWMAYVLVDCGRETVLFDENTQKLQFTAVAEVLRGYMGKEGFAARVDGFSFLLCFSPAPQEKAEDVMTALLAELEERLNRAQGAPGSRTYAGICRSDSTQGNLDKAVRETRIAAWCAREQGKSCLVSSKEMTKAAAMDYNAAQEILTAVDMAAFYVYILPMVDLPDRRVVGGQALVRWRHPSRGLLFPGDFLPYIEKTDKIKDMDRSVFEQICEWSKQRRDRGYQPVPICCNLSEASLSDSDLPAVLLDIMAGCGIRAGEVGIEVDAGILKRGSEVIVENIGQLRRAGVIVILDNFGSSETSLRVLTACTVDMVKLHHGLLPGKTEDVQELRQGLNLLDNTIRLCKRLGLRIAATGVENEAHHTMVCELGCDMAEGYYYYRPMPCDEFDRGFQNL